MPLKEGETVIVERSPINVIWSLVSGLSLTFAPGKGRLASIIGRRY